MLQPCPAALDVVLAHLAPAVNHYYVASPLFVTACIIIIISCARPASVVFGVRDLCTRRRLPQAPKRPRPRKGGSPPRLLFCKDPTLFRALSVAQRSMPCCLLLFDDGPYPGDWRAQYTRQWQTGMMDAPAADPGCCILSCCCLPCANYQTRVSALGGDTGLYMCCLPHTHTTAT